MAEKRRMAGALGALVAAAAIAGGIPGTGTAAAATAGAPYEVTTLPAPAAAPYRADTPVVGGATGFLHREQGLPGYTWTNYTTGADTQVQQLAGVNAHGPVAAGGDAVAYWTGSSTTPFQLTVGSPAAGSAPWTTYTLPNLTTILGVGENGTRALVREADGLHLLQLNPDGSSTEVPLSGMPDPSAYTVGTLPTTTMDAGSGAVAQFTATPKSGTAAPQLYLLRLDSGAAVAVPTSFTASGSRFSGGYLFRSTVDTTSDTATIQSFKVADLLAGTATTPTTSSFSLAGVPWVGGIAGGQALVVATSASGVRSLYTVPLATGGTPTLVDPVLQVSTPSPLVPGAGGVLAVGGTSTSQAVQLFSDAADGTLATSAVRQLPPPAATTVTLSMDYGQVRQMLSVPQLDGTTKFALSTTPLATASGIGLGTGPASSGYMGVVPGPCAVDASCVRLVDGSRYGPSLMTATGLAYAGNIQTGFAAGATIVDSDEEFEIVDAGGTQYLWEPGQSVSAQTVPVTGAALWQHTLWRTAGPGEIQAFGLRDGFLSMPLQRTISTGSSCAPSEIQVAQHWLYWSCGSTGPAGVYDLATNAEISVPSGPVLLGDGYVVRHDAASGQLRLTDVHADSVGATATVATFPVSGSGGDDRHLTWTVDRTSGDVAYADADNAVHVLSPGVPASPVSASAAQSIDTLNAGGAGYPWSVSGVLSRPVSSWRLVISRTSTGQQVHVATGGPTPAQFSSSWNGLNDAGRKPYSGWYTWQLWATPADDAAAAPTPVAGASGSVLLSLGVQPFRTFDDEGRPNLFGSLAKNGGGYSAGTGITYEGEDNGALLNEGSMAPFNDALNYGNGSVGTVVPFGDLNGDGLNDFLVRMRSGVLAYFPGVPESSNPPAKPVTIGGGWNIYNKLVSVGDLNGDGHDDLVARDSSGALWFYAGTGKGGFAPRVLISGGWNTYTQIVGVGDLNGDGAGDLLAVDAKGYLWRYLGNGHGGFGARTYLGSGYWVYNALVGVGDLNDDGHNDFVARDSSGSLWLYRGDGKGGFTGRSRIGGGWTIYSSLY
ncbi:hypothetical protein ABH931_000535 [Streptacidiphilus sp. MAP12-33]|uniref:FG-GAP repeat domain-containing protein n=1 Tax=Streptacidiphilus sp. MAP12-33 TaxID=3156266 RepID=UPI0035134B18